MTFQRLLGIYDTDFEARHITNIANDIIGLPSTNHLPQCVHIGPGYYRAQQLKVFDNFRLFLELYQDVVSVKVGRPIDCGFGMYFGQPIRIGMSMAKQQVNTIRMILSRRLDQCCSTSRRFVVNHGQAAIAM